ncbi:hypothetical protein K458DRAFT_487708 [Lentithecium fluviatile CBS 122367]|uniref:protein-ribulosamine 3-kinase n=1 Tax=Lentithecium fluviatile CBS 122367 TaxID=1168545 RepID=A0A6G1IZ77_9PLEO|nr:hypothetical protein K458DRAFT_487708 [Lentithecium fluviatile CBS 122367]
MFNKTNFRVTVPNIRDQIPTSENGAAMAKGEYEATKTLRNVVPDNVPKPVAHGTLASNSSKAFFLAEYHDMSDDLPDTGELVFVIAKIHAITSPTGNSDSILRRFREILRLIIRVMRHMLSTEREIQGPDEEMDELAEKLLTKVMPRLIRTMETGENKIKPVLLHAHLWHGNVGIETKTGARMLYDSASFYGHNEYDFGMWRRPRYRFDRTHMRKYHEISAPVEDEDDRNALYALRNDLLTSITCPANKKMRQLATEEMRRLVVKSPDGYEGYE